MFEKTGLVRLFDRLYYLVYIYLQLNKIADVEEIENDGAFVGCMGGALEGWMHGSSKKLGLYVVVMVERAYCKCGILFNWNDGV